MQLNPLHLDKIQTPVSYADLKVGDEVIYWNGVTPKQVHKVSYRTSIKSPSGIERYVTFKSIWTTSGSGYMTEETFNSIGFIRLSEPEAKKSIWSEF